VRVTGANPGGEHKTACALAMIVQEMPGLVGNAEACMAMPKEVVMLERKPMMTG
jgi:hypothetical protein